MPKGSDHTKAQAELKKLPPDTLQAVTVRLPAAVLMAVHRWAAKKGLDLASAIRELIALGQETAAHSGGQVSAADKKLVKKWTARVERALRAGQSPLEPFRAMEDPDEDLAALPAILALIDYRSVLQDLQEPSEEELPWVDRQWLDLKADAPSHLQPVMAALDNLEVRFDARKKVYSTAGPDGDVPVIHWLLSEAVMTKLSEPSSDDPDVEQVRKLIAARYLVADQTGRPWEYEWDD